MEWIFFSQSRIWNGFFFTVKDMEWNFSLSSRQESQTLYTFHLSLTSRALQSISHLPLLSLIPLYIFLSLSLSLSPHQEFFPCDDAGISSRVF